MLALGRERQALTKSPHATPAGEVNKAGAGGFGSIPSRMMNIAKESPSMQRRGMSSAPPHCHTRLQ